MSITITDLNTTSSKIVADLNMFTATDTIKGIKSSLADITLSINSTQSLITELQQRLTSLQTQKTDLETQLTSATSVLVTTLMNSIQTNAV